MIRSIGVVMDPMSGINTKKDSTFAMMLAAQRRGWPVWYMRLKDMWSVNGRTFAHMRKLALRDDQADWYDVVDRRDDYLDTLDAILMRKDPPFDMEYITATYLLEAAEKKGTLLVNSPGSLRDFNEKVAATLFPELTPPTLIARDLERFAHFAAEYGDIVVKPLDSMGGQSVFRIVRKDPNTNVILETLTRNGSRFVMAQRYIPEITEGDKRILIVDGDPVSHALARIPKEGEFRGNLATGGSSLAVTLTTRDREIAGKVGAFLREQGILFAGLDVIGDYLTEINITSPTCIRELDAACGLDIGGTLMNAIESRLTKS
jgi:glutathione synthase